MENLKTLRLSEQVSTKDFGKMRGFVKITDEETGEVILKKKNIIVYRGRAFALEKLFNDPIPPNFNGGSHIVNLNRTICLFTVGSGGAPEDQPFVPNVPEAQDYTLASPVPFRTVDTQDPLTALTLEEKEIYHNVQESEQGRFLNYYSKTFANVPEWKTNLEAASILEEAGVSESNQSIIDENEIFKYIVLKINTKDCRQYNINELGLQLAHYNEATGEYSDIELFSRITFPTESLQSDTKKLLIEYFIFA